MKLLQNTKARIAHHDSRLRLGSLPLVSIAFGPDPETRENKSTAHGIIALGDRARGVLALGRDATGIVALGGRARGVVAMGGRARGLFAMGGMAMGALAV